MKENAVDSTTTPLVMHLRRSTRKSKLRESCNNDVDSEVTADKVFGNASANQERHVDETLCVETLDSLLKVRRSTRKSRVSKTGNVHVDLEFRVSKCSEDIDALERDKHLTLLPSENNTVVHANFCEKEGVKDSWINDEQEKLQSSPRILSSGSKMKGLQVNASDLVAAVTPPHLQKSTRKSRLTRPGNVQVESEARVSKYSGDVDAEEERQGDKQLSLVASNVNPVLAAIDEREEKQGSWKEVATNADDQVQKKILEDCGDSWIIKEQEVSQRVLPTNSEDWVQQKNKVVENPCMQEGMLLETHGKFDGVKHHMEETEEDDKQMADLVSKHLLSHLSQKSMPSKKGILEEPIFLKKDRSEEISLPSSRNSATHFNGGNSKMTHPAVSSVKVSWSPRYGLPFLDDKKLKEKKGCHGQEQISLQHNKPHEPLGCSEGNLQDGLFVPSNDVRKLKKFSKKQVADTTGEKWFNMPAPTLTPELRKELQLLKLRSVIDPKRHYKAQDSKTLPKYFQIGTVVEGPADFFSGRLTKKERKSTFADELLSDSVLARYRKRKYSELQDMKQAGGKKFWKKKKNHQKPSWARV